MDHPTDLLPLERVAERLGVPRQTMWRRVKRWGLTVYSNPLDARQRLVSWAQVEAATKPRRIVRVTITAHHRDSPIWSWVSETGDQEVFIGPDGAQWLRTEAEVFPRLTEASEQGMTDRLREENPSEVIDRLRREDPSAVIVPHE